MTKLDIAAKILNLIFWIISYCLFFKGILSVGDGPEKYVVLVIAGGFSAVFLWLRDIEKKIDKK